MRRKSGITPPDRLYAKSLTEAQARECGKKAKPAQTVENTAAPPKNNPTPTRRRKPKKQVPEPMPSGPVFDSEVTQTRGAESLPTNTAAGAENVSPETAPEKTLLPPAQPTEDFFGEKNPTNPAWVAHIKTRVRHRVTATSNKQSDHQPGKN